MIQFSSTQLQNFLTGLALVGAFLVPSLGHAEDITEALESFHQKNGRANMVKLVDAELDELDGVLDVDPEAVCMGSATGALQCTYTNKKGAPDSKMFKSLNEGLLEKHSYGPFDYEEDESTPPPKTADQAS